MAFVLYTIGEATQQFNHEMKSNYKEETLRNRMKAASLTIHRVGNLDLIAKDDLNRLMDMEEPKRGRPPKRGK